MTILELVDKHFFGCCVFVLCLIYIVGLLIEEMKWGK